MAEHEAINTPSQGLPTKRTKRIATLEPSQSHVNFPWVAGWTGELGRLVVGLPQKLRIAGAVGTPFDALQQSSGPVRQPVLRVTGHRWKVLGPPLGPHWVPIGSPCKMRVHQDNSTWFCFLGPEVQVEFVLFCMMICSQWLEGTCFVTTHGFHSCIACFRPFDKLSWSLCSPRILWRSVVNGWISQFFQYLVGVLHLCHEG